MGRYSAREEKRGLSYLSRQFSALPGIRDKRVWSESNHGRPMHGGASRATTRVGATRRNRGAKVPESRLSGSRVRVRARERASASVGASGTRVQARGGRRECYVPLSSIVHRSLLPPEYRLSGGSSAGAHDGRTTGEAATCRRTGCAYRRATPDLGSREALPSGSGILSGWHTVRVRVCASYVTPPQNYLTQGSIFRFCPLLSIKNEDSAIGVCKNEEIFIKSAISEAESTRLTLRTAIGVGNLVKSRY